MNTEIFLGWLRYAIRKVGSGYYGYSERVYCYELYHFIRVAMYSSDIEHSNIFLHSEIVKVVLATDEARNIGVSPLAGRRSPDFILHEPHTADHQIAAVEVKTTPNLTYQEFIDDIIKLTELKENYNFQLCVFHCINIRMNTLHRYLDIAIQRDVNFDRQILIMAKQNYNMGVQEITIQELLTQQISE